MDSRPSELKKPAATLRARLEPQLAHLRELRDEVRLEFHLGGMQLRDQWLALEQRLIDVERQAAEQLALQPVVEDVSQAFQEFHNRLTRSKR